MLVNNTPITIIPNATPKPNDDISSYGEVFSNPSPSIIKKTKKLKDMVENDDYTSGDMLDLIMIKHSKT